MRYIILLGILLAPLAHAADGEYRTVWVPEYKTLWLLPKHIKSCVSVHRVKFTTPYYEEEEEEPDMSLCEPLQFSGTGPRPSYCPPL